MFYSSINCLLIRYLVIFSFFVSRLFLFIFLNCKVAVRSFKMVEKKLFNFWYFRLCYLFRTVVIRIPKHHVAIFILCFFSLSFLCLYMEFKPNCDQLSSVIFQLVLSSLLLFSLVPSNASHTFFHSTFFFFARSKSPSSHFVLFFFYFL